jgi:hypothetical protein
MSKKFAKGKKQGVCSRHKHLQGKRVPLEWEVFSLLSLADMFLDLPAFPDEGFFIHGQ